TTIAGNGSTGYSGDGGLATAAKLNTPEYIATDASNNVYFSDHNNHTIRKVTVSSGIITTVAGNGAGGYAGDGGQATAADLYYPSGVALDANNNIYISDYNNNVIRKVTASSGIISTIAGNTSGGFSGDGAQATAAELYTPQGLTIDAAGNVYVADWGNVRIRKIAPSGIISTLAGNGTGGFTGDGGPSTAAELYGPYDVKVDANGNLYIADSDNDRIRMIKANGTIITVVGNGFGSPFAGTYAGDGGPALSASLWFPEGVAVDAAKNVYIGDTFNYVVRKVNGPLAIDETTDELTASVYPNPTTDKIFVSMKKPLESDGSISLYSITGKEVLNITTPAGTTETSFSVGNLASGTYILKIQEDNGVPISKLIEIMK